MNRTGYITSILLLFLLFASPALSQSPAGGISYQAVALDSDGKRIADTDIPVRFSLLASSDHTGDPLYQEVHTAHTGSDGLFTLVIGMGDVTTASVHGSLSEVDFGSRSLHLRVETDRGGQGEYSLMGTQQLMSVPFAMHAASAGRYFMQAPLAHDPGEAVFTVRNSAGDTVFAVYESGVVITIDDDAGKGSRGGFAVGGFSGRKGDALQYLKVDPGDVRITIDDTPDDPAKGSRGGFAIGGFSQGKQGGSFDYFSLSPIGTLVQFDIDYDAGLKGSRGGFAVGGFSQQKSGLTDYLVTGPDSVRIYIDDTPDDDPAKGSRGGFAVGGFSQQKSGPETGFMHIGSGSVRVGIDDTPDIKGSRGGFAVGGFSQQKSGGTDYLLLDAGSALFTLDSDMSKGSRSGFAVGGFSQQKGTGVTDYLLLTADSARVTITDNLLTKGKGSRGGFAVGGFSQKKDGPTDILYSSPEKTNIYISQEGKFLPGGFSIFSLDDLFAPKDLFQVTRDTTRVAGVFAVVPRVITSPVTDTDTTSASGGGEVVYDGEAEVTGRGLVWSRTSRPRVSDNEGITEDGDGLGAFTSALTGLVPGLRYYVRAYATNVAGNGYGEQVEFFTDNIITATAGEGGGINPAGPVVLARGATQVYTIYPDSGYEIDDVTLSGTSVLGSVSIDAGTGIGTYTFTNNVIGTRTLGVTFKESDFIATVTDIDGNIYEVVTIGSQVWMAENLRTTRYDSGDPIVTGLEGEFWANATEGAYAVYAYDSIAGLGSDAEVLGAYGALYNWYATGDPRGLCPAGWRVPSDTDWAVLADFAGGEAIAGGRLKSTLTAPDPHPRWDSPNTGATDQYGFSGLPGGNRHSEGYYETAGERTVWWSSYPGSYSVILSDSEQFISMSGGNMMSGFSVRCILGEHEQMPWPETTQNYFENFNVNNDQGFSYLAEDGYSYTFNGEYNFSSGMDYFAHILLPLEATKDDFSFRLIPGSMYAGVQTTGFGRMGFRSFIGVMVNHGMQTVDVVYTEDMNYTESNLIPIKQIEFFDEILYAQLNVTRVQGNNMHVSLILNGMLVCNETFEGVDEGLFSGQMLLYLEKEELAEFMEASFQEFEVNYNPWIDTPGNFTDEFALTNPPWFKSGNFDVLSSGIFVEGGQMKFVDAGTGDYKELTVVAPVGPVRDFTITVEAGVEAGHTSELGIARFFDGMDEYVMLLYDGQTLSLVYDNGFGELILISDSTLTEPGLVSKIEFSVIEAEDNLNLFVNINNDPGAVVYGTISEAPQRIKSGHLAISFFGEQFDFIDAYIDNVTISYVPFTGEGFGDLFGGGSGTMMDPFIVETDEHLFNVRYAPNAHFRQGFNINLAESVYTSGVGGWMPIGNSMQPFTGKYDGNGMVIQNLSSGRSEENEIGLFGYTFDAHIHDLGLELVSIAGNQGVGGLVGISVNSLIERVSVTGMIEGNDWAGGIAGRSRDNSLIKDSWADAEVMGSGLYAGGLVGFNDFGAIISGCYSIGSVFGNEAVGGLVGWLGGGSGVNNSYSAASVNGSNEAGGFVGHNDGTITNCYSIGFVESGGNFIGGFSGRNETGSIVDSYWDTGTSGQETSFGGEGRATSEMNDQSFFPEWDFEFTWDIEAVVSYPFLQWQGVAGEHNATGVGL